MINHKDLGENAYLRSKNLLLLIRSCQIALGGNRPGRIYGTLDCRSGKKMTVKNRVFFADEKQAVQAGYRPCAHCLPAKYKEGKAFNFRLKKIFNENYGDH